MRLALASDQHGNDVAFRAALDDVERLGVEEIVCLGDVVQGGRSPLRRSTASQPSAARRCSATRTRSCSRSPPTRPSRSPSASSRCASGRSRSSLPRTSSTRSSRRSSARARRRVPAPLPRLTTLLRRCRLLPELGGEASAVPRSPTPLCWPAAHAFAVDAPDRRRALACRSR